MDYGRKSDYGASPPGKPTTNTDAMQYFAPPELPVVRDYSGGHDTVNPVAGNEGLGGDGLSDGGVGDSSGKLKYATTGDGCWLGVDGRFVLVAI